VTSSVGELLDILDLERVEVDIFRGRGPREPLLPQRLFGGQVAGQALVAAGRTVPADRVVHSLHAYFLRPGDPMVPIVYLVDRLRDGRSFTTRRVVGVQHGKPIFNLAASFQLDQPSPEHQPEMPAAPPADSLPTLAERFREYPGIDGWHTRPRPVDLRFVGDPAPIAALRGEPAAHVQVWMRTDGPLPDDPLLHVCALTFASDLSFLDSVLAARGIAHNTHDLVVASLDHAMWFHRPFRMDDWLLYDQTSPTSSGSRGLARGEIWTSDGRLAVSVVQEGMVRDLGVREPAGELAGGIAGPVAEPASTGPATGQAR
jgi:acyl-CoA thioesterase II